MMLNRTALRGGFSLRANMESISAKQGEKMIEVRVRFWTNDIAQQEGHVVPKHAWTSGVVNIVTNETHGITSAPPLPFHSLLDLGSVIEKALLRQGITLHVGRKMAQYIASGRAQDIPYIDASSEKKARESARRLQRNAEARYDASSDSYHVSVE